MTGTLLVAVLGLAGCASKISKADYISKADAVCSDDIQKAKAVPPATSDQPAEISRFVDQVLAVTQDLVKRVGDLNDPDKDTDVAKKWRDKLDDVRSDLQDAGKAARKNDSRGIAGAGQKASSDGRDARQLAQQFGFKICDQVGGG